MKEGFLYHRFLYKQDGKCYIEGRKQGETRKGYHEMLQMQGMIQLKAEYQSVSLCSFDHEPHGPLTCPYKTDQTDTVTL